MSKIVIISGTSDHAAANLAFYRERFAAHDLTIFEEHPDPVAKLVRFVAGRVRSKGLLSAADLALFAALQRVQGLFRRSRDSGASTGIVVRTLDTQLAGRIAALKPDIVVLNICSLLTQDFLSDLKCPAINVHNGITPRYRGAGNIWALQEDNPELVGVTLHHVDAGVDTGKAIARRFLQPVKKRMAFEEIDRAAFLEGAALAAAYVEGALPAETAPANLLDRFYPAAGFSTWLRARRNYRRRLRLGVSGDAFEKQWHEDFEKLSATDGLSVGQKMMWHDDTTVGPRDERVFAMLEKHRREGWSVLDVGCGDGRYSLRVGPGYVGCDYSDGILALGGDRPGTFVHASADDLPFAAGRFDATLAVGLLQHLYSAQRVVDELTRVTKIGGVVVINTLRLPSLLELAGFLLARPTPERARLAWATFTRSFSPEAGVAWRYSPRAVAAMFGSRGRVVEVRYDGLFGTRLLAREFTIAIERVASKKEAAAQSDGAPD